jgi:extracellular elastinolytic metalloproteinase
MDREIDTRQRPTRDRSVSADLGKRLLQASTRLAGQHRVVGMGVNVGTGAPAALRSISATAEPGDLVARTLAHVTAVAPALGLTGSAPELTPDPTVRRTSSGAAAVHLQQCHHGVPVFGANVTVRFRPDGAISETLGSPVSIPPGAAVAPALGAAEAVSRAATHVAHPGSDEREAVDSCDQPLRPVGVDVSRFSPQIIASIAHSPSRPVVFDRGPFDAPITAQLTWFPTGDALRLAWDVNLVMPGGGQKFRCLVDAATGDILYCRQLVVYVAAQGNVYVSDPNQNRELVDFPVPLSDYPTFPVDGLPPGFPDDWVDAASTAGNSTISELNGDTPIDGDGTGATLTFDPADPTADDQKVLNAFYYCSFMHDYFYLLGFREPDGNYQEDNFGRGGSAGDPVTALTVDQQLDGIANFIPTPEGTPAQIHLGTIFADPASRHTALDGSVVFHEYTHGVSTRLVGGGSDVNSLDEPQSAGMGEGWSDYIACTVLGTDVVGVWLMDNPAGRRSAPYDADYPNHFDRLADPSFNGDVHNLGEVWCAALMQMTRTIGRDLAVQLVIDAMKLGPTNPGFLDQRDAILTALDHRLEAGRIDQLDRDMAWRGIWESFATYGMGPAATSDGAQLTGISADFTAPAAPEVSFIDPTSGTPDGGTTVTIIGSGFTGATDVSFDATSAAAVNVDSDNLITVTSPTGAGTVDVTVTTSLGTSLTVPADQFTYA